MKIIDNIKSIPYMGKTVIRFTTHGCQATIHEFDWIGTIIGTTYPKHCNDEMFYVVKILKDKSGELRDNRTIDETATVHAQGLQNLGGDFYITYD